MKNIFNHSLFVLAGAILALASCGAPEVPPMISSEEVSISSSLGTSSSSESKNDVSSELSESHSDIASSSESDVSSSDVISSESSDVLSSSVEESSSNEASSSSIETSSSEEIISSSEEHIQQDVLTTSSSGSKVLKTAKTPSELEAKDIAYGLLGKLQDEEHYRTVASGKTTAKVLFVNYDQTITNENIRSGSAYWGHSKSDSTFVHTEAYSYTNGSSIYIQKNDVNNGQPQIVNGEDYRASYGFMFGDDLIEGYIMNDETISEATKSVEGDTITCVYTMHNDLATSLAKVQMKIMGGLAELPVYEEIKLTVTLKNDWTPVSVNVSAKYKITLNSLIKNTSCSQDLTIEYTDFGNASLAIPDEANYIAALAA